MFVVFRRSVQSETHVFEPVSEHSTIEGAKARHAELVVAEAEYMCSVCGGTNVEHAMWVAMNEDRSAGEFGTWNYSGSAHCNDCGENQTLVDYVKPEADSAGHN